MFTSLKKLSFLDAVHYTEEVFAVGLTRTSLSIIPSSRGSSVDEPFRPAIVMKLFDKGTSNGDCRPSIPSSPSSPEDPLPWP